jgi:hypothetical protein
VATDHAKHANCACFLEFDPLRLDPPTGQRILALDPASSTCDIECPVLTIDLGYRAHFATEPCQVTVQLPPVGSPLKIKVSFDEAYHLPFIVSTVPASVFACSIPPTFWRNIYMLVIGSQDPVTIDEVLEAFHSYQVPNSTSEADLWIVKRNNVPRTELEEQRTMFDQVHFAPVLSALMPDLVACRAVTSLLKPDCPEHVGQLV